MSRKRYVIIAKCFDKKKRQMAVGVNSYSKTSPVMSYFAEKVGTPCKVFLHAEVQSLLRCKDKVPYKITVERYDSDGNPALAKPCPICSEAIKAWGITVVEYTSPDGWIREVLEN